jgi:FlaA1/EpsC-like NDP-sugar epimerase
MRRLLGITGRGPDESRLRRAVGGRIVLVTGASEGIGAATARRRNCAATASPSAPSTVD